MRLVHAGLLVASLAACGDVDPMAPDPVTPEIPLASAPIQDAFEIEPILDALQRIVPSLGAGPAADALGETLSALLENPSAAAVPAIESALTMLEAEQPDAAVEADVIRLALTTRS